MSEVDLSELDALSRDELISRAGALGVTRPELLTRVELRDEIVRVTETDEVKRQRARGWLGVARDLVASVVEQRLNLPDAADLIRGVNVLSPRHVPPVATVTLAEIYAAQGHVKRALKMLDEVLQLEPEHQAAHDLRDKLRAQAAPEQAVLVSEPPEEIEEFEEASAPELDALEPLAAEGDVQTIQEQVPEVIAEPPRAAASEVQPPVADSPLELEPTVAEANVEPPFVEAQAEPVVASTAVEPPAPEPGPSVAEASVEAEVTEVRAAPAIELPPVAALDAAATASALPELLEGKEPEPAGDDLTLLIYRRVGTSIVCHWSISEKTWDNYCATGNGQWVMRVVQVTPKLGPIEPVQNDLPLPGTSGEAMLNDIGSMHQVRMALGWGADGHFAPVAIGVEVAGSRIEEVSLGWVPILGPSDPTPELILDCARRSWQCLEIRGDS